MAVDHEVVPEAPEPIDEGEQSEDLLEHLEVFNCFLHGYPALLYRLLTGARSDLAPGSAGRMEPKKHLQATDEDLEAGKGSCRCRC